MGDQRRRNLHRHVLTPEIELRVGKGGNGVGRSKVATPLPPRHGGEGFHPGDPGDKMRMRRGRLRQRLHPGRDGFQDVPLDDSASVQKVNRHSAPLVDDGFRHGFALDRDRLAIPAVGRVGDRRP